MPYDRFRSEEELLKSVLHSLPYEVYPKVSAIAGSKISPDIDILQIYRISENQFRLIGYELKLMKFDKRTKGLGWDAFYKGIGQALLYLKNGVQRVVLVLGFHENVPEDMIESFRKWLWERRELLKRILGGYISIGTFLYKRGSLSLEVESSSDFYPPDDETKFLSQALLQRKFTFNKKLKEG